MTRIFIFALLLASPVAANAQTKEHAPVALPSAEKLSHDKAKSESWTYVKPNLDLAKYRTMVIDPTGIYDGPDAQFDDVAPAARQKFANMLTEALKSEMAKSFTVAARPGPGTLRLKLTLLGVEPTKGGIATATRVTPIGVAASAVKSIAGKQGSMTGSALVALELTDGASGELQAAAVRRIAPDALDIPATLSTEDTVKSVARELARRVRERLEEARGKRQ